MAEAKQTAKKQTAKKPQDHKAKQNGQASGLLDIDPETFSIGEMEQFEEAADTSFMDLFSRLQNDDYSVLTAKVLKSLVWVVKRRADPNFTLEDAASVPLSDVTLGGDADPSS